jgi:hypothetical protein
MAGGAVALSATAAVRPMRNPRVISSPEYTAYF